MTNKSNVKADLTVRLVSFNLGGAKQNHCTRMDKQSFLDNVINSEEFNFRLSNGHCLGVYSHSDRKIADKAGMEEEIPYIDSIAKSNLLANVMRTCYIAEDTSGSSAYSDIDILDTPAGERFKSLARAKVWQGISMSTRSNYDASTKTYYIQKLLGTDFTLNPFFLGSGLVSCNRNFSVLDPETTGDFKNEIVHFSGVEIVTVPTFDEQLNADKTEEAISNQQSLEGETVNYDFRGYLREFRRPLFQTLNIRVREVMRYLRGMSDKDIALQREPIKNYLNDIIYNWISLALKNPGRININIGLRLNLFLKDTSVIQKFNTRINILKNVFLSMGYLSKQYQDVLKLIMNDLFRAFWTPIMQAAKKDITLLYPQTDEQEESKSQSRIATALQAIKDKVEDITKSQSEKK